MARTTQNGPAASFGHANQGRTNAEYATGQGAGADATSELIHRVFEFREKVARDVMVPRTDVVAVEIDTPVP